MAGEIGIIVLQQYLPYPPHAAALGEPLLSGGHSSFAISLKK